MKIYNEVSKYCDTLNDYDSLKSKIEKSETSFKITLESDMNLTINPKIVFNFYDLDKIEKIYDRVREEGSRRVVKVEVDGEIKRYKVDVEREVLVDRLTMINDENLKHIKTLVFLKNECKSDFIEGYIYCLNNNRKNKIISGIESLVEIHGYIISKN